MRMRIPSNRIEYCGSQLWAINSQLWAIHGRTTEYATRAGSCQISAIRSKRALFPYDDSCHVNYSAHKLYVAKVHFPALVAISIVAIPSYSYSTPKGYNAIIRYHASVYTLQLICI